MKKLIFILIVLGSLLNHSLYAQNKECNLSFEWEQISPFEYQLYAFSIPDSLEYMWETNTGEVYYGSNPIIQLSPDSVFSICLSVDSLECETICDSIYTFQETCIADFMTFGGNTSMQIIFESVSEGLPPLSYHWLISGDTVGSDPSITYTFEESGYYNICLILTTGSGCIDSVCQEIYIDQIAPQCEVIFEPEINQQFGIFTPTPAGSAPYVYEWFINSIPVSTEEILTYEFPETGEYSICVVMTTLDSCSAEYCETITISAIEDNFYISGHVYENAKPLANGQLNCYQNDVFLKSVQIINGDFIVTQLVTGNYKLLVNSGNPEYSDTWFGDVENIEDASIIFLNGNTWDVDIHMQSTSSFYLYSDFQINIYPNPFNNEICIETTQKFDSIKLIDQTGNIVFISKSQNQKRFQVQHLSSGVYFMEIMTNSGIIHQKLIKR